ncbi:RNA-binding protein 12B, partial [Frankliniella fusca]
VLRTLVLVALLPAALCAPQHVVSLEDVTGTTARSPIAEAAAAAVQGATQIGYGYDGHRPSQVGVVSLEDVTGSVEHTVPAAVGLPQQRPGGRPGPGQQVGVVSLEDVTGHVDNTVPVIGHPLPNLVPPQPRPGRPGQQVGVVSLEDVTGHADNTVPAPPAPFRPWPRPPPPHHYRQPPPGPGARPAESNYYNLVDRDGQIYQAFGFGGPARPQYRTASGQTSTVCIEQEAMAAPAQYAFRSSDFPEQKTENSDGGLPSSLGRHRARRSPKPIGVVSLENVAGPVAAHYPAYGPPAYVRPNYYHPSYYGGSYYYQRPRPYVYAVPCIGICR